MRGTDGCLLFIHLLIKVQQLMNTEQKNCCSAPNTQLWQEEVIVSLLQSCVCELKGTVNHLQALIVEKHALPRTKTFPEES